MRLPIKSSSQRYGIVVDSGSSGSRIQVYKWEDQDILKENTKDGKILRSPPIIKQEPGWTHKISPGISTYDGDKVNKIWKDHFSKLMKFAEGIIPKSQYHETPVFVLATAGMRLLDKVQQKKILKEICVSLQTHTSFYVPSNFIEVIPGKTEGIYGWLALNYLMGKFNNYDITKNTHESIGFMDMGGASTQIAFVPSSQDEIKKHHDDLSKVTLRSINGETQEWDLFVETWLGFGANEARKRYLAQLISLSLLNPSAHNLINDPCLPKGAELSYQLEGNDYRVLGIGNYEMCLKTIYPLLLKNIQCKEEPCLFNGIHAPKLNFLKDKFVGVSEYWYTANDIFQSGGEYNFKSFNEKVRGFCESEWAQILSNSEKGQYSKLDPDKFLKDACFKASWVINVLHEGLELPRLGLEVSKDEGDEENKVAEKLDKVHIPFKSASSVNGEELSWTLGRILLYASSQIDSNRDTDLEIGIYPSEISEMPFISGGSHFTNYLLSSDEEYNAMVGIFLPVFLFFLILVFFYNFSKGNVGKWIKTGSQSPFFLSPRRQITTMVSKIPILNHISNKDDGFKVPSSVNLEGVKLEEGLTSTMTNNHSMPHASVLRTRSALNLVEGEDSSDTYHHNPQKQVSRNQENFLNRPFVLPKRNSSAIYPMLGDNRSRDSLHSSNSNISAQKLKSFDKL